ncbi:MAG: argininosuccinate lyase, partial [Candidatus Latescibacterota bacterium]|nr:argininosuccinate lyase [Candidatus Latescibacterota bacterium]
AFDTIDDCLDVFTAAWATMKVNVDRMESSIDAGALATDLADYLVRKGVPFRESHHIIGQIVRSMLYEKRLLTDLTAEDLHNFDPHFEADAVECLDLRQSLAARNLPGGTGPEAIQDQLKAARAVLTDADISPH